MRGRRRRRIEEEEEEEIHKPGGEKERRRDGEITIERGLTREQTGKTEKKEKRKETARSSDTIHTYLSRLPLSRRSSGFFCGWNYLHDASLSGEKERDD